MFEAIKNKMKRDKMVRQFAFLVNAATVTPAGAASPIGYGLLPEKDANELVAAAPGMVSINPTVAADANGMVQIAITGAGLAANATAVAVPVAAEQKSEDAPVNYQIRKGIPVPAIQGRGFGARVSKYPFEQLDLGDSFFVPGSTSKSFASTITTQNKRYGKQEPKRQFTCRTDSVDGVAGVSVWRIVPTEKKPRAPKAS